MSAVGTIRVILDNDATLETMVGDRVYAGNYPTAEGDINERPVTPYIIVEELTTVPNNVINGKPNRERAILQIDVVGEYKDIKEVRDRIRELLALQAYEIESGSQWEEEIRMYRETMEWSFWSPR